jgi:hypothetical protein
VDVTGDGDHRLPLRGRERREAGLVRDRLHDAAAVAHDHEADRAELAHRLQPSDDAHALANARGDLFRSNPFHDDPSAGPAM